MPAKKQYKTKTAKKFVAKKTNKTTYNGKSLIKLIRRVALTNSETKFGSQQKENIDLYHNGGVAGTYNSLTNLLATAQGSNQQARVGDQILAKSLSIHLWLSNKSDRPNVMYRVIIYTCPFDQYLVASPSSFFQGLHGNKMLDYVNTDKYKIIYSKVIRPFSGDYSLESGASNKEHSTDLKIYIPLKNKKITYSADAGQVANNQNNIWNMAIIAYDAYGTLTTDAIASFSVVYKFYFKDP